MPWRCLPPPQPETTHGIKPELVQLPDTLLKMEPHKQGFLVRTILSDVGTLMEEPSVLLLPFPQAFLGAGKPAPSFART